MTKINRDDIHIISRHSNWTPDGVEKTLQEKVYNGRTAWVTFIRLFFISSGIGFTLSGIIFFFAYNWADLHKFAKIGLIQGLIAAAVAVVLFSKISQHTKNIILTGTAMLVGVLFAVFGQVYQTGANAFDFFLAWTVFITLWVIFSNFAPLWLIYLALINTTVVLYVEQVAQDWSGVLLAMILFVLNTAFLVVSILLSMFRDGVKIPGWFTNIVALAAVSCATFGICTGIFERFQVATAILVLVTAVIYGVGLSHGWRERSGVYLSVIPFSVIIIISALMIKVSDGSGMFLMVSIFIITSVTLVIKNLLAIQKKWTHEQQ